MTETIISWWMYEARLLPVLLALSIFSTLHILRKLTKVEYTPSYFAIFPISMLEPQLSAYFDEFYSGEYLSVKEGRKKNPSLYIKSWISFFMTFLIVPLLTGFVVAFILTPHEFGGFIILLLAFEGFRCCRAIYDFAGRRGEWRSVLKFFVPFYGTYLFFLWLVVRQSYHFTIPFTENNEYTNLATAVEMRVGPIVIEVVALGIITNLLAHWLVNKDAIEPSGMSGDE
jgi:hypothetical protein